MKYLNRVISLLVAVCCVCCMGSSRVLAFEAYCESENEEIDYYEINYSEVINLEGVSYTVRYSYDEVGNQCIDIVNTDTNTIEAVVYDGLEQKLYCNDEEILSIDDSLFVDEVDSEIGIQDSVNSSSSWVLFSSSTKTISSIETMTAMVFVAAVAAIVGTACTAAMVLANMGATAVNYIISKFEKAKVSLKIYKFNSSLITQFRYDWSVKPVGGSTYGPYTTMGQIY